MALRGTERFVAQNRRARHDYHIEESIEAGMQLAGTEVKVLRKGLASINEAYATEREGDIYLVNAHFPEYPSARFNHEPRRLRKLLLRRREINRLMGAIKRDGITLVPLAIYFNARGRAKLELGLAKGKRKADKREAEKQRDWQRNKAVAGRDLRRLRLVLGRHAAHRVGDAAVEEGEPVIGALAIGTAGEAEVPQRVVEQFAGVIARERPPGAVGAAQAGRQADHEEAPILAAEGRDGRVVPIGECDALQAAEAGEARAERTVVLRRGAAGGRRHGLA